MADKITSEYEYINKSETLLISIIRRIKLWSFVVRRKKTGEIVMNGDEDRFWKSSKKEVKDRLTSIFGELETMSDYRYRKKNEKS